ncbi:MAG: type IX secretion system protein PorQ [Thermoflexibacter sp.]|nr:type IX secretion system protein PorQ [Thermoflexibacter sp.]
MKQQQVNILKIIFLAILLFIIYPLSTLAQLGGKQNFSFLHLAPNARTLAIGGVNLTSETKDIGMFFTNPSLIDSAHQTNLQLNFFTLNAGSTYSTFAFQKKLSNNRFLRAGIQYLGYGNFDGFDVTGNSTGIFSARDYALTLSYAHRISPFTIGTNLKLVGSSIANFSSFGVFLDIASTFIHPQKDLKIGIAIKNLGFAVSNYTDLSQFAMPFDVQVGFSIRPEQMPIRFSITAHQLVPAADVVYNDPNQKGFIDANGNEVKPKVTVFDRVSRRAVIGAELLFSKYFNIRLGYNFMRRRELSIEARRALVGFSFGFMFKVKQIEIAYSRSIQHLSGGINSFAISLNANSLFKKKTIIE